ncbi:protein of unknown function [Oenococcus oeni]|uniref:Uncharacterized protein n=1 Tax=Oenococcus oeni TaxID=1247 RepID=A0AAQ2ZEU9_OENOE|nr:hypothetical protein OENI_1350005 [Oenococcus oeni]SYW02563.1 hypothetical protein OENI_40001 [Oenococcus oeni]SYW02825.1 hypothetical protein OENI_50136 [Oenococcus oeni]SYW07068.1 hypothetical protein OENI_540007 [Oenococcus oeni]SYW08015.1 hypothetical protein OENI_160006 [Oenococcus oeni]
MEYYVLYFSRVLFKAISKNGRLAQLGEHLPYKQEVTGSIPVASIGNEKSFPRNNFVADLAQLAEHRSCKAGVGGSNPLVGRGLPQKYANVVQW